MTMKIKHIAVRGLFGSLDHEIPLNDGGLTVTRTSSPEPAARNLFEDEEALLRASVDLSVSLVNQKRKELHKFEYSKQLRKISRTDFPLPLSSVERRLPFLSRTGAQQCLDARSGQLFSLAFIHGPNGFGKTTVLRLVHALLTGELQVLKTVDFKELEISYSDAHSVIEP
jgi:hypothetical protein